MFKNILLEEKWRTQKKMAQETNYDIKKLLNNTEKIVKKMIREHNVKLKIAHLKPTTKIDLSN